MPTDAPTTDADTDLIAACADVLDVPLELLARALLLDRVAPDRRDEARDRLRWLVAEYDAAGAPAADPAPPLTASPDEVVCSLAAAGHAPILLSLRRRVAAVAPT